MIATMDADSQDPRHTFPPRVEEVIRGMIREEIDLKEKGLPQKPVKEKE